MVNGNMVMIKGNSAIIYIYGASLNADADAFNTNPMNFKIN